MNNLKNQFFQKAFTFFCIYLICSIGTCNGQLKSMVYDFDGQDINQNNLPEGDYSFGDLTYNISTDPLTPNDMLGDRVLKLNLNWNSGFGSFGRGISRYIEFNPEADLFNFYFFNPATNGQDAIVDVILADDDNQSNIFEFAGDDVWKKNLVIPGSQGWQLISVPLKDFIDSNPGGNGVFDMAFSQNKGMLLLAEFRFTANITGVKNPVFYIDMINFSDGILPRGTTEFNLPYHSPSDYCLLGAFQMETRGENNLIPSHFEGLFPQVAEKKIKYANFFLKWAYDGALVPNSFPGSDIQILLNNGYTPIITWEPMFDGRANLDPVQPRLHNIISGDYNSYIDAFADKIKLYTDTVIIRFMHEFEGDWYPWSISQNGEDPSKYITAFRKVVDRFRARGVTNVQWMWCVNSDYFPYLSYNFIVFSYPGNDYVDIVATDIYNNHYPISFPWWRSFRWQTTESYYYLSKYFPEKPLYICEVGCRERFEHESPSSESKGEWYTRMDKEVQSNFRKARALIFFNAAPDQNWFVNSSPGALQSLVSNIWFDNYYFKVPEPETVEEHEYGGGLYIYPNPTNGIVTISYSSNTLKEDFTITITNSSGVKIYSENIKNISDSFIKEIDLSTSPKGIYYVDVEAKLYNSPKKKNVTVTSKLVLQ